MKIVTVGHFKGTLRDTVESALHSTALYLNHYINKCVYISVFRCVLVGLNCFSCGTELTCRHFKGKINTIQFLS